MAEKQYIGIVEAARLLGVSRDTVRRKIASGEYGAKKVTGPYGEQWQLEAAQFNKPTYTEEVAAVTKQISLVELYNAIGRGTREAFREEAAQLKQDNEELRKQVSEMQEELQNQRDLLQQLVYQQKEKQLAWYQRILGKGMAQ